MAKTNRKQTIAVAITCNTTVNPTDNNWQDLHGKIGEIRIDSPSIRLTKKNVSLRNSDGHSIKMTRHDFAMIVASTSPVLDDIITPVANR